MTRTPYIFSEAEKKRIRRLLWEQAANPFQRHRNVLILDLVSKLGCRPSEALYARTNEIDWNTGVWRLPAKREKAGREKVYYLTYAPVLLHHLRWYKERFAHKIAEAGYLFPSRVRGHPIGVTHFSKYIFRRACPPLVVDGKPCWHHRTMYDLRATKFTTLFRKGYKMEQILQLSQHSNPQTLWKYYILAQQEDTQRQMIAET